MLLNIMTHGHHCGDYTWDPDSVPKILEELREVDEEVRDLLSKILLNIMTHGHHGGDYTWDPDSVPQILEELRKVDEEVRDLLNGEISNVQSLLEELPGQFFTYMRSGDVKPLKASTLCGFSFMCDLVTL
nr:protein BONZAI 3-like [Tanacetum cinerariifolium]